MTATNGRYGYGTCPRQTVPTSEDRDELARLIANGTPHATHLVAATRILDAGWRRR
jgi:hypothetical protein